MKKKLIISCLSAFLALVTCILILCYASYKKVDHTLNTMQKIDKEEIKNMTNENIPNEVQVTLKDRWTVALFGTDSRDSSDLSSGNSDVIIIASIDNKTGDIKLASVYRDTCLKTGKEKYKKVNSAYAVGGPKNAVEVLNENLDLQIDDYIATNWSALATAINILGGVDINITDKEFKYINSYITETVNSTDIGSYQLTAAGPNHLDGVQAVAYCRLRYTDNDFKRTERQRLVLSLLLEKAKTSDLATINNLITAVFPMTSSSIDTADIISVGKNILNYNLADNTGFPFEHKEKKSDSQDFVFPYNLEKNVSKLHGFLYGKNNYMPSSAVITISNAIESKYNESAVKNEEKVLETLKLKSESKAINEMKVKIDSESLDINETAKIETSEGLEVKDTEDYGPGYVETKSLEDEVATELMD